MPAVEEKLHTQRWAYQKLYQANIFELCTKLYPFLRRPGFQVVSRLVALTYALTQTPIRAIVRDNLRLLIKGKVTELQAVRVFLNFAATIADYVAVGAMPKERALALCVEQVGLEHIVAATKDGEGVILATGHYSFFEFGLAVLSGRGHRVTVVTLPEPSSSLMEWRSKWRTRWGTETVCVGGDPFSSIQVIRAIESGHCMAMLVDRPFDERTIVADLPNGRTTFSTSPALLSWMTGRPVLPVLVTRLPWGRYRITAKPPIQARRDSDLSRNEEIARCTREIATSLFEEIRRDPLQWYQFVPVGK